MLTREQLVGHHFLPFEEVDVPALKGTVGVQGMTAGDAISYFKLIEKSNGKDNSNIEGLAKLLVRCLVDENRQRIYTDDEWPEILKWPHLAVEKLARTAMRLNRSAEGN